MGERTAIDHDTYRDDTADLAASMTEAAEQMEEMAANVARLGACFETFGEQGDSA